MVRHRNQGPWGDLGGILGTSEMLRCSGDLGDNLGTLGVSGCCDPASWGRFGDLGDAEGPCPGRLGGGSLGGPWDPGGRGGSPGGGGSQRIPVAQVIGGNEDPERVVLKDLAPPAVARALRVYPRAPRAMSVCLRLELYGCPWDGEWRLVTPPGVTTPPRVTTPPPAPPRPASPPGPPPQLRPQGCPGGGGGWVPMAASCTPPARGGGPAVTWPPRGRGPCPQPGSCPTRRRGDT